MLSSSSRILDLPYRLTTKIHLDHPSNQPSIHPTFQPNPSKHNKRKAEREARCEKIIPSNLLRQLLSSSTPQLLHSAFPPPSLQPRRLIVLFVPLVKDTRKAQTQNAHACYNKYLGDKQQELPQTSGLSIALVIQRQARADSPTLFPHLRPFDLFILCAHFCQCMVLVFIFEAPPVSAPSKFPASSSMLTVVSRV